MGIDFKSSIMSMQNFTTPGIGAVHFTDGKPPIGAMPGLGTVAPKFEQGLAGKLSGMAGMNMGAISADSYKGKVAGSTAPSEAPLTSTPEGLAVLQVERDKQRGAVTAVG